MEKTHQLTQDILQEREIPDAHSFGGHPEINDKELTKRIITYLRLMADGELDEAQKTADLMAPYRRQATLKNSGTQRCFCIRNCLIWHYQRLQARSCPARHNFAIS
jgi:hypothetical protein